MKKAAAYTLGCKVNQYESEAVLGMLKTSGYDTVAFDEYADVYIINTCTVTGLADRKCRQAIRKARKINPAALVVAMGCYSQVAPEEVAKIKDVNIIIGTNERKMIPDIISAAFSEKNSQIIKVDNIMNVRKFEEIGVETYTEHTRAFMKIQDGCNRFCSYCIIPYARGPVRSREPEKITAEVQNLSLKGYSEFVLTGIHLASYGVDLNNTSLPDIIMKVSEIESVKRIRLGSIEPMTITPDFIELVKNNKKICPHFHISLQSGCDSVLKRMNRKYTAAGYYNKCMLLKNIIPDISLTTDIIVGFPGETEDEFNKTCEFAEKTGFSKIHVFKFSPRKGTPAASMENQVHAEIKDARSSKLIELSDKMAGDYAESMLGKTVNVLFERKTDNDLYEGHAENYLKVICRNVFSDLTETDILGRIIPVKISGSLKENLAGTIQL